MYPFRNNESPDPSEKWGLSVLQKGHFFGNYPFLKYQQVMYTKERRKVFIATFSILNTERVIIPRKVAGKAQNTGFYQSFQNDMCLRNVQRINKLPTRILDLHSEYRCKPFLTD